MSFIGTSCIGASSGGSVNQLIALGAMNVYLTQDPTMTFWRTRYDKYTNFVMEPIEQVFNTQVAFGSESQVLLQKTGDLAYFQLLIIDLPGITTCESTVAICGIGSTPFPCADPCNPCGDPAEPECVCPVPISVEPEDATTGNLDSLGLVDELDTCTGLTRPWAHWVNAVGQFIPKRVCLVIGGQQIDVLYNDYLFMWEELTGQPGKRLTEMIGKRFTLAQLVMDSKRARRLYVPLPFWYTLCPGNALALISLQFHGVQLNFCFETLTRSVSVSDCNVTVVKCSDCTPLVAADLQARIETEYVYLDIEERDRFATSSFEQLITQVQALYFCTTSCQIRLQLNFNHPIIELIWAARRECQDAANNHFNYSGVWGRDPIEFVALRLNNQPRFSPREGRYFRLVVPWEFHTDIPEAFVYCFSFALYPENTEQPSGACNFSRIDTVELVFELQPQLATEQIMFIVFGRNWNIFRYRQGLGGLAFAS